jgi:hypothetical protein
VSRNWGWPDLDESHPADLIPEEPVFKDKPESLLAPSYLNEGEKSLLNKLLDAYIPMFTK